MGKRTWEGNFARPPWAAAFGRAGRPRRAGRLRASRIVASWPPSGEPAARSTEPQGKSWPPSGEAAAQGELAACGRAAALRQAWRASRLRASRRPAGRLPVSRPAGRLRASRPPQGKPGELAASSGEPAAICSKKVVLNFGFGPRQWGSPPAVALANFFVALVERQNEHSVTSQFISSFCVSWRARHISILSR